MTKAILLNTLIADISTDTPPSGSLPILGITSDSRQVQPGWLFVAYEGVSVDGHHFIADAVARGAAAVIAERTPQTNIPAFIPLILVADGRAALAEVSAAWYDYPSRKMTVIGVTGTDGKTSTANLIYHILQTCGKHVGMISTVNAVIGERVLETGLHTTTPDAPDIQRYLAEMADAGTEFCVLETTSHGLAQHRVTGVAFAWAVVTNITHEHLDLHGSLAEYRRAKATLFGMARVGVVLNADDDSFNYLPDVVSAGTKIISYGQNTDATVYADEISLRPDATACTLHMSEQKEIPVRARLVGAFNVSNMLAAWSVAVLGVGCDAWSAADALWTFAGVPGRMERIDAGQPFLAIVDFAHTPNALRRALETARALSDGRVIAVFGSAGLRDVEKRRLMGEVAAQLADITIITAEDPRTESLADIMADTAQAMARLGAVEMTESEKLPTPPPPAFYRIPDRGNAIFAATQLAHPGDVVIALGKGHEQSMCFGETEYPWDDRAAMRSALAGKPVQTLPTAQQ